jgi:hypothetical protein
MLCYQTWILNTFYASLVFSRKAKECMAVDQWRANLHCFWWIVASALNPWLLLDRKDKLEGNYGKQPLFFCKDNEIACCFEKGQSRVISGVSIGVPSYQVYTPWRCEFVSAIPFLAQPLGL